MLMFWLLVILGIGVVLGVEPPPKVTTKLGVVKGAWLTSYEGRKYAGFTGLPYAKPPVGNLRFEPPAPVEPWEGEWDASHRAPLCMAYAHLINPKDKNRIKGQEDCLYLNVYSPQISTEEGELLPVIIFIHGGAFMFSGSALYGAKYFMDRQVVLVTISYRLGPLGFLSLEDEVQPGNNGMRDQVAALKWVQQNIQNFGGNPDSVTLMGQSAGGASVHYHYLSPMSKGLFHRGISVSGTALCRWALADAAREKALSLAASVGCPTEHGSKILIDCLKTRPAERILEQINQFQVWQYSPFSPFAPVVEKSGSSPFLPETPARTLSQGTMQPSPWITGVTTAEGLYPAASFVGDDSELEVLNSDFTRLAPHLLDFNLTVTPGRQKQIAGVIRSKYFGKRKIDAKEVPQVIKMISDRLFVVDAQRAAELQASHSHVYFYEFDFRGQNSLSDMMSGSKTNFGVSHADDVTYYMNVSYISDEERTDPELEIQKLFLDLWTNFANTGVPSPIWSPVIPGGKLEVLEIKSVPPVMTHRSDLGNAHFWESLPFLEGAQSIALMKKRPYSGGRRKSSSAPRTHCCTQGLFISIITLLSLYFTNL